MTADKAVRLARAVIRLFLFAIAMLVIIVIQTPFLFFCKGKASYTMPRLWHAAVTRIFGIKVRLKGIPATEGHILYVGNHLSYLDVPVIGQFVKGSFVARGDLSRWPVFGFLSSLQQTIFISRKRQDAIEGQTALEKILAERKNIIMFAEGTSSDGHTVLPFKSSLFRLALNNPTKKPLLVQPFTIKLVQIDDIPANTAQIRDLYAWHGEMTLPPHIWAFAQCKNTIIEVIFHPPRNGADYKDRKKLCLDCYFDVKNGLNPEDA